MSIEGQDIAIIDLGCKVGSVLVPDIERNILTHGKPFESGGLLGPACLPILGAGSAVASSLLAGNVFLATANPATLMDSSAFLGSSQAWLWLGVLRIVRDPSVRGNGSDRLLRRIVRTSDRQRRFGIPPIPENTIQKRVNERLGSGTGFPRNLKQRGVPIAVPELSFLRVLGPRPQRLPQTT